MMMLFVLFCFLIGGAWCDLVLPSHMKLGAGASAFQSEGAWNVDGKSPSVLDTYYRSNKSEYEPDEACKSYELYKQDVQIAKDMGLQFYRFSLAWTRILPDGFSNNINEAGVNYYNNLIDELLANGIEPVVTLLQFDFPQCLQDLGGWNNPESQDWFADYARVAFSLFGDRVKTWLTINEPLMTIYNVGLTILPKDQVDPRQYAKNILLAHAKAWRIYDEEFRSHQNGIVSFVNQMMWLIPESEEDVDVTELSRQYFIGLYSHPVYSDEGGWPKGLQKALAESENANPLPEFTDEEIEMMRGTYDFYGLNFYTSKLVRKVKTGEETGKWPMEGSSELGVVFDTSPDWATPKGENPVTPEGIRSTLSWLNEQYGVKKFFIAENGISSKGALQDNERSDYIYKHLEQLCLAENEGDVQVIGYTVWTIMDDFEFKGGYESKFGLYSVNFTDPMRARTPRKSAHYYKSLISNATNGLPIVHC